MESLEGISTSFLMVLLYPAFLHVREFLVQSFQDFVDRDEDEIMMCWYEQLSNT